MRANVLAEKRARAGRRQLTLPEVVLWERLRSGRLQGLRFRRQRPIGPYILDFFCADAQLAIEVDGEGHGVPGAVAHDAVRDRWISEQGVRVLRFAAADVLDDARLEGVLRVIAEAVARVR